MTLIEKLERGPGSRELSDECLLAVGWHVGMVDGTPTWRDPNGQVWVYRGRPDPSQNLQDALDWMVPGRGLMYLNIRRYSDGKGAIVTSAVLWPPGPPPGPKEGWRGNAPTLPLSVSAASLRAREAMKEKDDDLG